MNRPVVFEPSMETISPQEADTVADLLKSLRKISEKVAQDEGHAHRSVHAKSHGLLFVDVEILDGLPPELAQGAFAKPAHLPGVLRLSTTPGDLLPDKVSTPRGVGLKLIGVAGARLAGNDDATQDFVLVNGPVFSSPDATKFAKNLKLLAATTDKMPVTKNVLSAALRGAEALLEKTGHESPTFKSMGGHPATNILGERFWSQTPILYGDYVAKVSLVPVSPELLALKDQPVNIKNDPDALRTAVLEFFAKTTAVWELRVQLCTDPRTMPMEDASVEWPEAESPYRTVARVTALPQVAWSAARSASVDDGMSFSPWHCLAAHRPLGSINRARQPTYAADASFRASTNRVRPQEPRQLNALPD